MTQDKKRLVVRAVGDAVAEDAEQPVKGIAARVRKRWLRADGEYYKNELQRNKRGRCRGKDVDNGGGGGEEEGEGKEGEGGCGGGILGSLHRTQQRCSVFYMRVE